MDQYQKIRIEKLEEWKKRQIAYPGKFEKTHTCLSIKNLPDETKSIQTAGRLMAIRVMGKIAFCQLQDTTAKLQLCFQQDVIGQEEFKFLTKKLDIGDHIGVSGYTFTTQKGEKTLQVERCQLLSKNIRPLPEKFHGLTDPEMKSRYRFLDLMMHEETRKRFQIRNKLIRFIRNFLDTNNFVEVETPILQNKSSGASARPFQTHHNALDIPLFLRIAPETYLKRLIAGGYERVYELGKCFRNEGIDASHLQEFTMLEWYAAYWDYKDNMSFVQSMIQGMFQEVLGTLEVEYEGQKLNFDGNWPVMTYRDLVMKYTNVDLHLVKTIDDLKKAIKEKKLDMQVDKYVGLGGLIDGLYKKYCRPHLIQPTFITRHHVDLVPLARRSDDNSDELDMFQLVVNGWELVKAYSELVDPLEQKDRLLDQLKLAEAGDDEAMMMEEDFLMAMEYGMPPISGLGFGIERVLALITDSHNIRDVIYFPSLRPPSEGEFEGLGAEEEKEVEKK